MATSPVPITSSMKSTSSRTVSVTVVGGTL
jgi:hypothetical protein